MTMIINVIAATINAVDVATNSSHLKQTTMQDFGADQVGTETDTIR